MTSQAALNRILRRLDKLPALPRAVFLLHRLDDLDYAQIGFRLGIGIEAVERHFADAMYALTFGAEEAREDGGS